MNHTALIRNRFSLLEILVTIGIMAVVASILLPTAARSRNKGNQMQCLSQCRQMGMGLNMYSDENDGYLPVEEWFVGSSPDTYWTHKAKKYFGDPRPDTEIVPFLSCPSMPAGDEYIVDDNRKSNYMVNDIIFRYKGGLWAGGAYESIKIDSIVTPTKTAMILCGSSIGSISGALTVEQKSFLSRCGLETQVVDGTLRFPHVEQFDKANIIYADTHIVPVSMTGIPSAATDIFWDPTK